MLNLADQLVWLTKVPKIKKLSIDEQSFNFLPDKAMIRALLEAARDHSEYCYVLYATAVYTGIRVGFRPVQVAAVPRKVLWSVPKAARSSMKGGPAMAEMTETVRRRLKRWRRAHGGKRGPLPYELRQQIGALALQNGVVETSRMLDLRAAVVERWSQRYGVVASELPGQQEASADSRHFIDISDATPISWTISWPPNVTPTTFDSTPSFGCHGATSNA